jgi:hypothetical protein
MDDVLEKKPQPPVKGGVYNPDSGAPPPQDIDGGSVTPSKPKPKVSKPKAMAKGGSASARADGCAQRGKTKGRMV